MPVNIALEKLADIVVTGHSASRNACLANCRPVVPRVMSLPQTVPPLSVPWLFAGFIRGVLFRLSPVFMFMDVSIIYVLMLPVSVHGLSVYVPFFVDFVYFEFQSFSHKKCRILSRNDKQKKDVEKIVDASK